MLDIFENLMEWFVHVYEHPPAGGLISLCPGAEYKGRDQVLQASHASQEQDSFSDT